MITVNCIGLGHWGPNLVRNFASNPESRIGMVCDLREDRIALVRRNIPAVDRGGTDFVAAATDPSADAVVIATPVHAHFELARTALEAGKHVLVEKPLCRSVAEGRQLLELARKQNRQLCVGHVFLFNRGVLEVRKLIREGTLGPIRYIYACRTNLGPFRTDINSLWDLASHDISILNYWLDSRPLDITARGECYLSPDVEDVVVASLTYPDRVMACVHASWLNPRKVRETTVVGEHRMVVWNDMDLDEPIRIYDKSVDVTETPAYSDTFGAFRMQVRTGNVVIPPVSGEEPLAAECGHFIDCVMGRCRPINDGSMALAVLEALEAADHSMQNNSALAPVGLGPVAARPQ